MHIFLLSTASMIYPQVTAEISAYHNSALEKKHVLLAAQLDAQLDQRRHADLMYSTLEMANAIDALAELQVSIDEPALIPLASFDAYVQDARHQQPLREPLDQHLQQQQQDRQKQHAHKAAQQEAIQMMPILVSRRKY